MWEQAKVVREGLLELLAAQVDEFAMVLIDPEGNFRSWHPGVEQQLGYTAEEFIGANGEILLPLADRMRGAFHLELKKAASQGKASDRIWLVKKNGQRIFVNGFTVALRHPETNELLGFGKIFTDITERKKTEDDLSSIARTLEQSVVYIQTWNGVIEHWTAGCQRIYGWSAQEAVGRVADEFLHSIYPVPYGSVQQQLRDAGGWQGEIQQKKKDGSPVYVSAYWVAFSDQVDAPRSIISTHTDITQRLQMQRELEAANQQLKSMALELERSNNELEEFARITSHDLAAPILSARWLIDLLQTRHAQALSRDGQDCLRQVSLGLERMTALVEGVLAHAVVGKKAIGASSASKAQEAVANAMSNLQKDLELSGAKVTMDSLPALFIQVQPLAQLFQNLLSNAIKYRRSQVQLCIHISSERRDAAWVIGVHDNGRGIGKEWLERIFQPFQRLDGREVAGSGIGLATCRKIVTRAGGEIWAESDATSGSTFYFLLPGPP